MGGLDTNLDGRVDSSELRASSLFNNVTLSQFKDILARHIPSVCSASWQHITNTKHHTHQKSLHHTLSLNKTFSLFHSSIQSQIDVYDVNNDQRLSKSELSEAVNKTLFPMILEDLFSAPDPYEYFREFSRGEN